LGIGLYLGYVVSIGGDFMSGRFLTLPFLAAVLLLAQALARMPRAWQWSAVGPACLLGLLAPYPSLLSDGDYGLDRGNDFTDLKRAGSLIVGDDGISDERAWHYRLTGLWRVRAEGRRLVPPLHAHPKYQMAQRLAESGEKLLTTGAIGLRGFVLGPEVHVLDVNALADPLLSKLPVLDPEDWRISHFTRPVPCGYPESLEADANMLRDPHLARVYDAVRLVTRGPLFSLERLAAIVRLNTGHYDADLAAYRNDADCP
jgi:arabinofuranosyltransferase